MEETGNILALYGTGRGKSAAALGIAISRAESGQDVVVIQFLKGQYSEKYLARLEPEIRFFRFERSEKAFSELSPEEQQEERANIRNGLLYARKVMTTGECDLLILDEVLGIVAENLITEDELLELLGIKSLDMEVILTGNNITAGISDACDSIINFSKEK